jgi:hypothetical protein
MSASKFPLSDLHPPESQNRAASRRRKNMRAVLQDIYDNEPAKGRKNNDLKLITSLVYKF